MVAPGPPPLAPPRPERVLVEIVKYIYMKNLNQFFIIIMIIFSMLNGLSD